MSISQNPSYFKIGELELNNADVYSILKTKKSGRLYVSTNQGLYYYKNGKMIHVEIDVEQLSSSLFGLVEDADSNLYCFNLNGQVFTLKDNKLKLFYTIPSKYLGPRVYLQVDNKNNIVIASKTCIILKDGKENILKFEDNITIKGLNKLSDSTVALMANFDNKIGLIRNGSLEFLKIKNKSRNYDNIFYLDSKLYGYSKKSKLIESINSDESSEFIINEEIEIGVQPFSEHSIWIRSSRGNLKKIELDNNKFKISKQYFDDVFISKLYIDSNGIMYLGTFGEGVIVVSNTDIEILDLKTLGTKISHIVVNSQNDVFLTDLNKGIFNFNTPEEIIYNNPSGFNGKIFITEVFQHKPNSKYPYLFFNNHTTIESVKDIYEVDENGIIVSSSNGLYIVGKTTYINDSYWRELPKENLSKTIFKFKFINERCHSVSYDTISNQIFVATHSKLVRINSQNPIQEIYYNKQPIIANDILLKEDKLFCATKKQGVLVIDIKTDTITSIFNTESSLSSNIINKIKIQNNRLIVLHSKGIEIINLENKLKISLGKPEGIVNESIKDFSVSNDNIWLISDKGLIAYPLHNLENKKPKIDFKIDSIYVSGKRTTSLENLKHYQNKFRFYIDFNGIPYESEAKIYHKMEGLEEDWNIKNINSDYIEYKFLPSNKSYTFMVKAKFREYESDVKSIKINIKSSFWQSYWFYAILLFLFFSAPIIIHKNRTRKLNTKARKVLAEEKLKKDIIEVELKALRSQINPHFIFNSLNSIQDLVLKNETSNSYNYIVLFSNLVRSILTFSNQQFITLKEEIVFLERYLKLEKLRFGDDLIYTFNINIANDSIQIPSLILQPFIENAILHGLFHKKDNKKIELIINKINGHLICIVKDNGIGRKQSNIIKKRRGKNHKSYALKAIEKRFEILRTTYGDKIGYKIEDLYKNSKNTGTKVTIILPYVGLADFI